MKIGGRECAHGFDWSVWQTPRALHAAKTEGHEFFVVKASEGDSYRDRQYSQHVANGVAAGLTVGAYHFARPDWSDGGPYWDGRQEARLFLSVIDTRIMFVVLDLEATVLDAARTTDYVNGFWDQVIESGRYPLREQRLLYVGYYFGWQHTVHVRDRCCLWVPSYTAGYARDPDPARLRLPLWSADLWPEGWCCWQYTSSGTVAGLNPSDRNVGAVAWLDAVRTGTPAAHTHVDNNLTEENDMQAWQIDGDATVYAVWLAPTFGPDSIQDPARYIGGPCQYAFSTEEDFLLAMGREHRIDVLRPGQDDRLIARLGQLPRLHAAI